MEQRKHRNIETGGSGEGKVPPGVVSGEARRSKAVAASAPFDTASAA